MEEGKAGEVERRISVHTKYDEGFLLLLLLLLLLLFTSGRK